MSEWQSPIAPGISWYQATVGERLTYPALDGSTTADVAIVGGGFTGLQAAFNLAHDGHRPLVHLLVEGVGGDGDLGVTPGLVGDVPSI